ncbi:MAG: Ig-like domain-containing protein [Planctomycetes bacterium]|nr:Ig-like domain-containing protein [Planctomycetota bacterium]
MRRASTFTALCLTAAAAAGCWRNSPEPVPFEVARTSPALGTEAAPLLLNDSITVYFSAPVQPLSVTEDSVTVLDEAGRQVRGALRVASNWVTFEPEPPLAADLRDGSFRPGATYRLQLAGSPRPDAIRSVDGRRLAAAKVWSIPIAATGPLLRPLAPDVPFLLRLPDLPQPVPMDAPRLRLHFTQPLLPSSVLPESVQVRLLRNLEVLVPRSVRVLTTPRIDPYPGCTLEVDLGSQPRLAAGGTLALAKGDFVSVELVAGASALTDYSGTPVLPGSVQWWSIAEGGSLALAEWPAGEKTFAGDDALAPCFEVRGGAVRPRVRVEAGDGALGAFRPTRDTVLRPGEAFDRGDGTLVQSRGDDFPFTVFEVPAGVTVTVDATNGPARILVCGGARIAGVLQLVGKPAPLRVHGIETPAAELLASAAVALLAAGDLYVHGAIRCEPSTSLELSPLTLLTAGRMHLRGELPFHTLLAIETPTVGESVPGIDGPRGQTVVASATFTYGVPPGADYRVHGWTPWRQLPPDRDRGTLRLVDPLPGLLVAWQAAPADPLTDDRPDARAERQSQPQPVRDGDLVVASPGSFVRVALEAQVRGGQPLPSVREIRLLDR